MDTLQADVKYSSDSLSSDDTSEGVCYIGESSSGYVGSEQLESSVQPQPRPQPTSVNLDQPAGSSSASNSYVFYDRGGSEQNPTNFYPDCQSPLHSTPDLCDTDNSDQALGDEDKWLHSKQLQDIDVFSHYISEEDSSYVGKEDLIEKRTAFNIIGQSSFSAMQLEAPYIEEDALDLVCLSFQ